MNTITVDEAKQRDLVRLTLWLNPEEIIRLGAKKLLTKTWVLREYNRIKQDPERDVAVVKNGGKIALFANDINGGQNGNQ